MWITVFILLSALFSISCFATPVFAQAVSQEITTSRDIREYKTYSASLTAGMTVAPIPAAGLSLGYFYDSQSVFQLEYSKGKVPLKVFDVAAQTISVNYKRFFWKFLLR
jgi:hypothetical protein